MTRYSTQPSKGADVITDSPTSKIKVTKDTKGLEDTGKPSESVRNILDLDDEDVNE